MTLRVLKRLWEPFRPLPTDIKLAVCVIFLWMLLLSAGVTAALIKQTDLADKRFKEQQATAKTARLNCERVRDFSPELIEGYERVHIISHGRAMEFRRLIPAHC